jgi:hypothetical protein
MAPFFLGERGVVAGRPYKLHMEGAVLRRSPMPRARIGQYIRKGILFRYNCGIVGQCSSLGTGCNSAGQRIIMGTLLLCLERC